jgi:hypothetical protein
LLKRNKELEFEPKELESNDWFEADLLKREPHVKAITDLLLTTEGQFVMTLSSPWGTGKTTFMRMWKAYLEHKGHPCVLFNAWEHDYVDNPFLTVIAEMYDQLYALKGEGQRARRTRLSLMKNAGKKLFPRLLSLGVKAGVGVTVDFESLLKDVVDGDTDAEKKSAIEKIGEGLSSALSSSAEAYASTALEEHKNTKKMVQQFTTHLEKVVENLGALEKPMFFFVDELDRCKPSYSIELLEAVKHLFEAKGIIFVLSLDREQLGHSVRAAYGDGIDADGYLRRFIDLEYRIPKPDKNDFVKHLADVYGIGDFPIGREATTGTALSNFLKEFSEIGQYYSLRTIEKAFLRGTILLRGLPTFDYKNADLGCLAPLVFARELDSEIFDMAVRGNILPKTSIPLGLSESSLTFLIKHKSAYNKWGDFEPNKMNVSLTTASLRSKAEFLRQYKSETREHLVDVVLRYLDLSEQLVPETD